MPCAREEPTQASWSSSGTADSHGICPVTARRSPSSRQTGQWISYGEESGEEGSWTRGRNSWPRTRPISCPITPRVKGGTHPESPRLLHCGCQAHDTHSFSPLAALLPEHTTPELLYLETKWAALTSYGMSVKLLHDVLPLDEPLQAVTIRNHVFTLAERLEDALGEEHGSFIAGCPRDWGALPTRCPSPMDR